MSILVGQLCSVILSMGPCPTPVTDLEYEANQGGWFPPMIPSCHWEGSSQQRLQMSKGLPCKAQPRLGFYFFKPTELCFHLFLSLKRQLFKSIQLPAIFESKQGLLTQCGRLPRTTVPSILWMSSRLLGLLSFKTRQ